MPENIIALLPWIVPPLLGAIIGYITNAVAISMLFRPYREIRIFGMRVPFTPGIIPRQRFELSKSIAQTVESELINEEVLRRQTGTSEFRENLMAGISSFSGRVLDKPLSRWSDFLPEGENKAGELVKDFFFSGSFEKLVLGIVSSAADTFLDSPVTSILGGNGELNALLDTVLARIPEEGYIDRAEEGIEGWIDRQAEQETRLSRFFTDDDFDAFRNILSSIYMPLFDGIMVFLKKDTTLNDLEIRGRHFFHDVVEKLSGLQRLVITAGQFDRAIDENMDRIVIDLVANIEKAGRNDDNRKNVLSFIEGEIRRLTETPLGNTPEKKDRLMLVVHEVVKKLKECLADEKIRASVTEKISRMLCKEDKTLRSILGSVPGLDQESIVGYLSGVIVRGVKGMFSSNRADGADRTPAVGMQREVSERTLGQLLSIDGPGKASVDVFLTDWMIGVINNKIPDILKSVGIQKLVVDRIDSFDIVKMERLILQVVKKHLRWITIFGGFLGAVIGLVQIVVNRFI